MSGRRRAERRDSPGGRSFGFEDRVIRGEDRREFIRRMSDLAAELEAATPDRATRMERMAAALAERIGA